MVILLRPDFQLKLNIVIKRLMLIHLGVKSIETDSNHTTVVEKVLGIEAARYSLLTFCSQAIKFMYQRGVCKLVYLLCHFFILKILYAMSCTLDIL